RPGPCARPLLSPALEAAPTLGVLMYSGTNSSQEQPQTPDTSGLRTIAGLQPEDEAEYDCQSQSSSWGAHCAPVGGKAIWGPGRVERIHGACFLLLSLDPSITISLSLSLPGSWAQSVLTQPPSVSGNLGQRVTISCTGNSSNIGGILPIAGLQPEDEADYYCLSWGDSLSAHAALQACGEARHKPPLSPAKSRKPSSCSAEAQPGALPLLCCCPGPGSSRPSPGGGPSLPLSSESLTAVHPWMETSH
ncbi:Immunoglobulin lambda variable 1-40, partial [Galemys pyrenaicus]